MVLIVLGVSLFVIAGVCAGVGLLLVRAVHDVESRARADMEHAVRALVTPPEEGAPSVLAVYTDQMATLFAGRLMQQLKTASAGTASSLAKAGETAAVEALSASSPWVGMVAGMLPKKFRAQLLNHPQFAQQLSMFGAPSGNGGSPAEASTVRSRLNRGGS